MSNEELNKLATIAKLANAIEDFVDANGSVDQIDGALSMALNIALSKVSEDKKSAIVNVKFF